MLQTKGFELAQQTDDQWIHCIHDTVGNSGKSIMAEFLEYQGLAFEMPMLRQVCDTTHSFARASRGQVVK